MPLQATSGAASYDAFGGGVPVVPAYIEEVFSTWLFSGNNSSQTIPNNIDLSTNGGLVWIKPRNIADTSNTLYDTARGVNKQLSSESDGAESTTTGTLTAFNTNGFSIGTSENASTSGSNNVSWTWRKQPKFFDVVTWTGSGANRTIAHNLGSVPGCIIVKRRNTFKDWQVYHRSLANTEYLVLNSSAAKATGTTRWNSTTPTSTVFSLGTDSSVNASGDTYVAYLFAHDAGGFGLTGTDNVISCGSFTPSSNSATVNLGYEPQWILIKNSAASDNWQLIDNMRGWSLTEYARLFPNTSDAEGVAANYYVKPNATGFDITNFANQTYIYIAIRRGPMKVPTDATKVFTPVLNSDFTNGVVISGQPTVDVSWSKGTSANQMRIFDRLRGSVASSNRTLYPDSTGAEGDEPYWALDQQNGVRITATIGTAPYVNYFFSRAAGFFDEVCYTGNNVSGRTITHNLAAVPELMIVKSRTSNTRDWIVYSATNSATNAMNLNNNSVTSSSSVWASTAPTSTVFTVSDSSSVNDPAQNYVAYLFATVAGVSKVGSYTGTGALQTINCGFASGARFILIKRTDSTGDWYLYNSASGITSGNDPYFLLNSAAAQVTNTNYVDTDTTGFKVTAAAPAALNASGGSYIFLAIA